MGILSVKVKVRPKAQKQKTKRRLAGNALSIAQGALKHLRMVMNHDTRLPLRNPNISNDRLILRNDVPDSNKIEDAISVLENAVASTVKTKTNR